MNPTHKLPLQILALILAVVSLACSVLFWLSFGDSQIMLILAALTGAALEGCKLVFFPVAFYQLTTATGWRNRLSGLVYLVLALVLLAVSVGATVGYLESVNAKALKPFFKTVFLLRVLMGLVD